MADKYKLKDKGLLCYDYGTNIDFAIKMAEFYGRVYLYCPYEEAYPHPYRGRIGTGIENVIKIYNIWDYFNEIDIFCFPHLFQGSFQMWLRSQGKVVYGSGRGEDLEIYRDRFKELQKQLDMPLNDYKVIEGFDDLVEHLKLNDDLYIKNNVYRGLMETWHHDNYRTSKPFLDFLRNEYGMFQNKEKFIVETPIKDACEYGFDSFCVDGKFPENNVAGVEVKDSAYICKFISYKSLPKAVLDANVKLSPILEMYGYRGWYSNEMRSIGKDKAILTDMTCRSASPPTTLAFEMFENAGEYVWEVANGIVPNVKSKYKYGCQIIITSEWARKEPLAITFPEKYKSNVRIKNLSIEEGVYWFLPQVDEMTQVGCVLGWGDTLKQATEMATKIAKEVKGFNIEIKCDALEEANEVIEKMKKQGINLF